MDTPGLDDVKLREMAAKEISKALKRDGDFKVFFVITLEAGRVRPSDKVTIKLVLDAAPDIGCKYGIIVNKMSKKALNLIQASPASRDFLQSSLFKGLERPTLFVFYNMFDKELQDEDNVVKDMTPELK
eukprot:662494-Heterocapsa_arctica.AAC.1